MRKLTAALAILAAIGLAGCDHYKARQLGHAIEARNLPAGAKLMSVQWKDESLWRLYYLPGTRQCIFEEESALLKNLQGKVIFNECEPAALMTPTPAPPSDGS